MTEWLILDCPYLCWRAHYSTGHLSHKDMPTGVIFGFFSELKRLQKKFMTENVAFCFDMRPFKRVEIYPQYKAKRNPLNKEEVEIRESVHQQIELLRLNYLELMGHRNIFWQKGYEADDIIASLMQNSLLANDMFIIVSSDRDLLQLIGPQVSVWNPQTKEFPIPAVASCLWSTVKALSGCKSDNVDGIDGIGETTACKFLSGKLKPKSKTYQRIVNNWNIVERNLPLVELPYSGVNTFDLQEDKLNSAAYRGLCKSLGMESLI